MSSHHFLKGLFIFGVLILMSSIWIRDTSSLSDTSFANIFSHSIGCLLVLWIDETREGDKTKRQQTEWEKIFANVLSDKWLVPKIYKELIKLNTQ